MPNLEGLRRRFNTVVDEYLATEGVATVVETIQEVGIKRKTGNLLSSVKYTGEIPGEDFYRIVIDADYASYLNQGYDSFDMKCLVDGKTKILTSNGWTQIKEVKANDLVLTHTGKFRRVIKTFCEENKDEFVYQLHFNKKKISFTANHPILTSDGWKRIDQISNNDKIIGLAKKCKEIEKEHKIQYLSFWSKEIFKEKKKVIEKVERILKNHNGEYLFFKTNKFKIEKIKKTKFGFFKKWNLEVDIDNSFIVNGGLVVHNSGLMGKTIPMQTSEGLIFRKVGPNSKGWIHPGFKATHFVEKAQKKLYEGILKVVNSLNELSPEAY